MQRTDAVDELARLVGEDPLTRLPNRRSLEAWLREALEPVGGSDEVTLVLLDIEGLGDVNDEYGHAEGDRTVLRVADGLARATLIEPGSFPARVAGDEFCIGVRGGIEPALRIVEVVRDRLLAGPPPQPRFTAGIATVRAGTVTPVDLLREADAAQFQARHEELSVLAVGPAGEPVLTVPRDDRSPSPDRPRRAPTSSAAQRSIERWAEHVDEATSVSAALEALGETASSLLDLNRWVLSEAPAGSGTLRVRSIHARRRRPNPAAFAPLDEEVYELADYPQTAWAIEHDECFFVDVDDVEGDADERALLREYGQRYLVAVPATDPRGDRWLLELYGDERSTTVPTAVPLVEAIGSRTLGRQLRCRSRPA